MTSEQERKDRVLAVVVATFLRTGEPVSSRHVAETAGLGLSPATIRSLMTELEDEGRLSQPHTSAGRIPTMQGYRYYVRHLMPPTLLPEAEKAAIARLVEHLMREHDARLFLQHIAAVIAEVTDLIGVAMTPLFDQGVFERLDIVALGGSRYLVVLSLRGGLVKTINVTVPQVIPRERVEETARLLTERLGGLTVAEIKDTMGARTRGLAGGNRHLVDVILHHANQLFAPYDDAGIHVAGLSRVITHEGFSGAEYSTKLLTLAEHKSDIADSLHHTLQEGAPSITIGGGGLLGGNPPFALVSAPYIAAGISGALAVMGPTRMDYARLLAIVRHTAAVTSRLFPA